MQKVLRCGNSLAVVIPARFAQELGVKNGDNVKLVTKPEIGRLTIIFSGAKQLPLKLSAASKK